MRLLRSIPRVAIPLAAGLFTAPAIAQPAQPVEETDAHADSHADSGDIVVAGHPPTDFGLLTSTASLKGDALTSATRGQIGETLARLPGVSATSFSPGASRPVLRGLDGDRIRVLVDGIGSIDASSVSADHAVVFDPLTVDHIDVVHGPAVLIFGGQAIGGAVNALDKRIPRRVPEGISVTALGGFASAADERSAGGAIDFRLGDNLAAHIDANIRTSGDLRVGGFVHSDPLRAELLAEAAELRGLGETAEADEFESLAGLQGKIPNSAARSSTLGAGLAWIGSGGNIGVSVQRFDTRYGVPLRPGAGHHAEGAEEADHGSDPVAIDLDQTRIDLRAALNLSGGFDSLQFRGAWSDYRHTEFEGAEAGTVFTGNGVEMRADLVQADSNGWRGRSGAEFMSRKLTIAGPEAFTPDHAVRRFGLFTLQSLKVGSGLELEAAGRFERVTVESDPIGFRRSFSLWSAAAGISWSPDENWKLGINYIRGARAPAPEEMLSNGLHVATQAFEIGNPAFVRETSDGFEAYARFESDAWSFSLTGFQTDFGNFITARPTGEMIENFPVFRYAQLPARFRGIEASATITAARWQDGALTFDGSADYTHAELKGIGQVPRIPPLRLKGGVEAKQGGLRVRGEVEWNDAQKRVGGFENPVPGFTLVNISIDWRPMGEDGPLTVLFSANNMFDVVARRASSFTRDFVPLAGRDIRLGVKIAF